MKEKCDICCRTIACNHKAILCEVYNQKVHIKCNKLSKTDYDIYKKSHTKSVICLHCIKANIPFSDFNKSEFNVIVNNGVLNSFEVTTNFAPSDFQRKVFEKLNAAIKNNAFDLDTEDENSNEEILPALYSNYYNVEEFST